MAKALGCRWVEFDVRLTADGEPVLLHDNRLERTTNGRGRVTGLPLSAVRRLDAGSWFDPLFAGERVPKLEEALALIAELGLSANVELKAAPRREAATGALVVDLLTRTWSADPACLLISSFQLGTLAAARDRAPYIARGTLFRRIPRKWRSIAEELGCATIHADHQRLRPPMISEILRAGYRLLAYTVNDRERARCLLDWGVTSVFSDVPHRLGGVAAGASHHTALAGETAATACLRQVPT